MNIECQYDLLGTLFAMAFALSLFYAIGYIHGKDSKVKKCQ